VGKSRIPYSETFGLGGGKLGNTGKTTPYSGVHKGSPSTRKKLLSSYQPYSSPHNCFLNSYIRAHHLGGHAVIPISTVKSHSQSPAGNAATTPNTNSGVLKPFTRPSMKVFSSSCTFDYSWEEVSTANWRKYCPWNDKSTHVIAVDTLSRSVDPSTGIVCPRLIPAPRYITTNTSLHSSARNA